MNNENCPICNVPLTGRHCLSGCGFSRATSREAKPHKKPEPGDGQNLIDVMREFNITLPRNAAEWRRADARGTLPAFNHTVRVLATDGVVAWFLLGDGRTTFFGHLAAFVPEKKAQSEKQWKQLICSACQSPRVTLKSVKPVFFICRDCGKENGKQKELTDKQKLYALI